MIDYDYYGHCVLCHEDMRFKQIVGGKEILRFSPKYREVEYELMDKSIMKVAMCKHCEETAKGKEKEIMKSVIKGWDVETDMLVQDEKRPLWTQVKKVDYMKIYKKKKILKRVK